MNTKLTNAYIKERVLLNLQIRELEQKARKLLKNYGTPSYYALLSSITSQAGASRSTGRRCSAITTTWATRSMMGGCRTRSTRSIG